MHEHTLIGRMKNQPALRADEIFPFQVRVMQQHLAEVSLATRTRKSLASWGKPASSARQM